MPQMKMIANSCKLVFKAHIFLYSFCSKMKKSKRKIPGKAFKLKITLRLNDSENSSQNYSRVF